MKMKWKIVLSFVLLLVTITISTSFIVRNLITNLIADEKLTELSNYSSLGLSLLNSRYPGNWSLDGDKLYKGDILMNDNFEVVDDFSKNTGILSTLFAMDTRISTTVKDEAGNRKIGTKASDEVIQKVLKNGETYIGTANILDRNATTYYIPLKDSQGSVVGMWFVGIYSDDVKTAISDAMTTISVFLLILALLGSIITYVIGAKMSRGYIDIKQKLHSLE